MLLLEFDWTYVAPSRMATPAVVEAFDVVKDILAGFGPGAIAMVVNQLRFERSKETFDGRLVVVIPGPAHARYQPGIKVDSQFLRELFAREERRKVSREATVRYYNRYFEVPERYIRWSVWVANFFDETVEIRAGNRVIGE